MKTVVINMTRGLLIQAKERVRRNVPKLHALAGLRLNKVLGKRPADTRVTFKPVTCRLEPLPGIEDPYDWDAILDSVYDMSDRV